MELIDPSFPTSGQSLSESVYLTSSLDIDYELPVL